MSEKLTEEIALILMCTTRHDKVIRKGFEVTIEFKRNGLGKKSSCIY
jgi:hypothetical protein